MDNFKSNREIEIKSGICVYDLKVRFFAPLILKNRNKWNNFYIEFDPNDVITAVRIFFLAIVWAGLEMDNGANGLFFDFSVYKNEQNTIF